MDRKQTDEEAAQIEAEPEPGDEELEEQIAEAIVRRTWTRSRATTLGYRSDGRANRVDARRRLGAGPGRSRCAVVEHVPQEARGRAGEAGPDDIDRVRTWARQ